MKTAEQMVAAYQAAMASPQTQTNYKNGINGYNGNPMALAATPESQALYSQNTQAAVTSGRMAAALNAASPQEWKQNATTVGAMNLASGARKAGPKQLRFYQKAIPIYAQMKSAAASLPKGGGLAGAQARANAALAVLMQGFSKA